MLNKLFFFLLIIPFFLIAQSGKEVRNYPTGFSNQALKNLRTEMADSGGMQIVSTVAQLTANNSNKPIYKAGTQSGVFLYKASGYTEDSVTVFAADGGGYKVRAEWLENPGVIKAQWAGVVADGVTDNYAALMRADAALDKGQILDLPNGTIRFTETLHIMSTFKTGWRGQSYLYRTGWPYPAGNYDTTGTVLLFDGAANDTAVIIGSITGGQYSQGGGFWERIQLLDASGSGAFGIIIDRKPHFVFNEYSIRGFNIGLWSAASEATMIFSRYYNQFISADSIGLKLGFKCNSCEVSGGLFNYNDIGILDSGEVTNIHDLSIEVNREIGIFSRGPTGGKKFHGIRFEATPGGGVSDSVICIALEDNRNLIYGNTFDGNPAWEIIDSTGGDVWGTYIFGNDNMDHIVKNMDYTQNIVDAWDVSGGTLPYSVQRGIGMKHKGNYDTDATYIGGRVHIDTLFIRGNEPSTTKSYGAVWIRPETNDEKVPDTLFYRNNPSPKINKMWVSDPGIRGQGQINSGAYQDTIIDDRIVYNGEALITFKDNPDTLYRCVFENGRFFVRYKGNKTAAANRRYSFWYFDAPVWENPQQYFLDYYGTNIYAAYSLRLLNGGFAGSSPIRIEKGTGGQADIDFVNNYVDSTTIKGYSEALVYVTKWYDQSGNNRDLAGTSTSEYPKIILSSSLTKTADGFLGIYFNADILHITDSLVAAGQGFISIIVFAPDNDSDNDGLFEFKEAAQTNNRIVVYADTVNTGSVPNVSNFAPDGTSRSTAYVPPIDNTLHMVSLFYDGTDFRTRVDGVHVGKVDVSGVSVANIDTLILGRQTAGSSLFEGHAIEWLLYQTNDSTVIPQYEDAISNRYGQTW